MNRLLTALAMAALLVGSAAASERTDVMAVVKQWIDALDKGDLKTFVGLCAEQTSILDDVPPHEWQGADACSNWLSDNDEFARKNEITDGIVILGKPLQIDVSGNHAYVVTRDDFTYKMKGKPMKQRGSIHTFILHNGSSGWRITGESWANTSWAALMGLRWNASALVLVSAHRSR